ncbi:beta-2 adrenergic receptor-like [Anneissia japonica]|uniref:beta-2 adrenergic receptor-like n=1 Tax=Anneissia japonica TaxID=1529436 RepID=UPI0014254C70|nr:beta-2 adrenergic receptor-like [Anneissia japonica]
MELFDEPIEYNMNNDTDSQICKPNDYNFLYQCFSIVIFMLMPIVLIGNGLIIAVVIKFEPLQKPSYLLLASLAISDFISGIVFGACITGILVSDISVACLFVRLPTGNIPLIQWCISQTHIVVIAIERYKYIMKPFQYLQHVTKRKAVLGCIVTWAIGIFTGFLFYISKKAMHLKDDSKPSVYLIIFYISLRSILYTLAIGVTVALHVRIYREARRHSRQIAAATSTELDQNTRFDIRAARTTARILWVYLICIFPSIIISIGIVFPFPIIHGFLEVYGMVIVLTAMINAVANPLIYARRDCEFRHAVAKLVHISR